MAGRPVRIVMAALAAAAAAAAAALTAGAAALAVGGGSAPRVLLVGDSLTAGAEPAVRQVLATARHRPELRVAAVPGSGLVSGFDWRSETARLVAGFHPDVVVFEFIGNYFAPYPSGADGAPVAPASEAFYRLWGDAAATLTAIARAGGARVLWVLPPPMSEPTADAVAARLAADYRRLAAPGEVEVVDERAAFSDTADCFRETLWVAGRYCVAREADGVHLTPDGDRLWADVLARALDRRHLLGLPPAPPAAPEAAPIRPFRGRGVAIVTSGEGRAVARPGLLQGVRGTAPAS